MRLFSIPLSILVLLSLLMTGCTKKTTTAIAIGTDYVEAAASGGEYSFTYMIEESAGAQTVNASSPQEWINGFDTSSAGTVKFNVDPNPDARSREGVVEVGYGASADAVSVRVIQGGNDGAFQIVCSATSSSIVYRILPSDKGMTYMYSMMDKETFESYADKADICSEEVAELKEKAEMFGRPLEDYLRGILQIGDSPVITEDLMMPESDFYVYAYGLDADGTVTVPLVSTAVSTKPLEKTDAVFHISNEQDGNIVTVVVEPMDDSQTYIRGTVLKSEFSDNFFLDLQNDIFSQVRSARNLGQSDNDILDGLSYKGRTSEVLKLETEMDYVSYAVAIDANFLLVSEPSSVEFRTSAVEVSDNKIVINVSQLHGHFAMYEVTTTNSDNYVLFVKKYSTWSGMSDEDIIESLTLGKDLTSQIRSGNTAGFARELEENTSYAFVAFGYNNKKPTTGLTKCVFTTPEAQTSPDGRISISYDKYFDGTELSLMYPGQFSSAAGKAVLPVQPLTEGYLIHYYYQIFEGDLTGAGAMSDDEAADQLRSDGITDPSSEFVLEYGKTYTLMAFGIDFYEDYTPVFRQTVVLDRDGASPAEEYKAAE